MRRTSGRIRKHKQKLRRRYTCDREDRQLAGDEPTEPSGAVRDERVDPSSQGDVAPALTAALVRQALREGWAVPEAAKGKTVDELLAALHDPDTDPAERVRLFRLLLLLDQTQRERDRLEEAVRTKVGGGTRQVNIAGQQVNLAR